MIIRKPTMLDIVKIAAIMCPDSNEERAEFVSIWLQKQQEEIFVDLVAVHKKKVLGFVAGNLVNVHLAVIWMKAETQEMLQTLWEKLKKNIEFETAGIVTSDPTLFQTLGFVPSFIVMQYKGSDSQ